MHMTTHSGGAATSSVWNGSMGLWRADGPTRIIAS